MSLKEAMDSAGRPIRIGSTVRFRGEYYTIKEFVGTCSPVKVLFEEKQHTEEVADEFSVDVLEY